MKKMRQQIRWAIMLLSLMLFPVTMFYFSPYLSVMGIANGILAGSVIVFLVQLVAAMVLGRAFCGWLCPMAGLQEALFQCNPKIKTGRWHRRIKYFFWLPWIGIMVALGLYAGGIKDIDFLYQTTMGISIVSLPAYVIYYGVVLIVMIMAITGGKRSFCHSLCWMAPFMQIGVLIGKLLRIPRLYLAADSSRCIHCKLCDKACPMSLPVSVLTEKGSVQDLDCILCGACADTCPKKVLQYTFNSTK